MSPDLEISARRRLFHWMLLIALSPILSGVYLDTIRNPIFDTHRDFGVFFTASTVMWQGDALMLFRPETFRTMLAEVMGKDFPYLPFPYPPHSLFLLAPLAFLPYLWSLATWLTLTFSLMIAALWRWLAQHWAMTLGLFLCPASVVNMAGGQNGFLSAALLAGGLLSLERRQILGGILIGFLSYKPQLGLLLPLLLIAGGYWRAFFAAAVTVIGLVLLSAAFFGIEAWRAYLTESGPFQAQLLQHWTGRFQFMSPTYFMAGRLLGFSLPIAWAMQASATLLAAIAAIWAFRQNAPHTLKAAVAMVAVFIISPYVLIYDMTIVSAAILLALSSFIPRWWEYPVFIGAWVVPAFTLPASTPVGPLVITILYLILLRRIRLAQAAPTTGFLPTSRLA